MKKILVCGATGFIGGALSRAFEATGVPVRNARGRTDMDLTKPKDCEIAVRGCDLVFVCAGVTGGSGALERDPLSFVTPNLLIHANLFVACKAAGVKKVICLSSSTGYPDTEAEMREEDYFSGELHGSYFNPGHTKRFIERLGAMYADAFDTVFLRPSVVYGPGDDYELDTCHVIPALVRKVAERQNPIVIWGDGQNWRDAVYIDDMVRALLLAAEAPAGAYNIACGEGKTVDEILSALLLCSIHEVRIEHDLSRPVMLRRRVLNTDKAMKMLGWYPQVSMEKGLMRTLDWYNASK